MAKASRRSASRRVEPGTELADRQPRSGGDQSACLAGVAVGRVPCATQAARILTKAWTPAPRSTTQADELGMPRHRPHSLPQQRAAALSAAGARLPPVARPLGPGSGGASSLNHYDAWMPPADERAAPILSKRLPRPGRVEQTAPMIVNGKALACRCGNVTTWAVLVAERGRAYPTCRDCGAQGAGSDPNPPTVVLAD